MTREAYERFREKLIHLANLNKQIASFAVTLDQPLKNSALDLRAYAGQIKKLGGDIENKARELEAIYGIYKEKNEMTIEAVDKTQDLATIGINLDLINDMIEKTHACRGLGEMLSDSDDLEIRDAVLGLRKTRLKLLKECAEIGLQLLDEPS